MRSYDFGGKDQDGKNRGNQLSVSAGSFVTRDGGGGGFNEKLVGSRMKRRKASGGLV